jgi:PAS domain S-box-containing protein
VTTSLRESLEMFTAHHHVAFFHRDPGDLRAAVVPFLWLGLGRREKCLAESDSLALCLYGMEELPTEILLDALRTHPFLIWKGRALENLSFVPPGADPSEMTSARELRERLDLLAERHAQTTHIRRQAIRLKQMQDVTVSLLRSAAVPAGPRSGTADRTSSGTFSAPGGSPPGGRARAQGFLSVASVPLTESGKPVGALAVYANTRDAFDRGAVEELTAFALQASLVLQRAREFRKFSLSEERFRRLFDHIPAACFTFDRDGIIRHWNLHCRTLYGYSPQEAVGKPVHPLIVRPEDRESTADILTRVFAGESFSSLEREDRCAGGGTRWLLSNVFPYRGVSDEVELGISVNVDISGQVEARRALVESEAKFRAVVEEINVLIVELDHDGRIRLFNRAADRITGYAGAEVLAGKEAEGYGNPIRTKDGGENTISWNTKAIRDANGGVRGVVGLGVDVTERRKMEEEKERLRLTLTQAQKMQTMGSLAGGIAHDYKKILGTILGHTSLLQSRMKPDNPFRETVRRIEESAERAAWLTTQLLGFARVGKTLVEPLSLNDVVGDVVAIVSRSFDRSVTIRTDLEPALRAVEGDPEQLRHSLLNLCINARDAMPSGRGGRRDFPGWGCRWCTASSRTTTAAFTSRAPPGRALPSRSTFPRRALDSREIR